MSVVFTGWATRVNVPAPLLSVTSPGTTEVLMRSARDASRSRVDVGDVHDRCRWKPGCLTVKFTVQR
jgi:hypothetical protein